MSHVYQRVKIFADRTTTTVSMLVDTGATLSVIPKELAQSLGVKCLRRPVTIRLADGQQVKAGVGPVILRIDDREVPAMILVGDVVEPILGVETLETMGLTVDPRSGRVKPSRGYAVRLGGYR